MTIRSRTGLGEHRSWVPNRETPPKCRRAHCVCTQYYRTHVVPSTTTREHSNVEFILGILSRSLGKLMQFSQYIKGPLNFPNVVLRSCRTKAARKHPTSLSVGRHSCQEQPGSASNGAVPARRNGGAKEMRTRTWGSRLT